MHSLKRQRIAQATLVAAVCYRESLERLEAALEDDMNADQTAGIPETVEDLAGQFSSAKHVSVKSANALLDTLLEGNGKDIR